MSAKDKFIHFTTTWICNFRCEYCSVGHNDPKKLARKIPYYHAPDEVVNGVIAQMQTGEYSEILLSGGEPTIHPRILDIAEAAGKAGMIVQITTNFSQSNDLFRKIENLCELNLGVSLHLSQIDIEAYIKKMVDFHKGKQKRTKFYSTVVITNHEFDTCVKIKERLSKHGITLHLRAMMEGGKIYGKYHQRILDYAKKNHINLNPSGMFAMPTMGKRCTAGKNSIKITNAGDVYRCVCRSMPGGKLGSLKSFKKNDEPEPCTVSTCNCSIYNMRGAILD